MNSISWIDGLVALCLILPGIRGWQSGLVPGLLRLGGIVVGAGCGWIFADSVQVYVLRMLPNLPHSAMPWICALLAGLLGWNLGILVGWIWRRSTKDDPIGWLDRFAGLALGLGKGAAFVIVLLAAVQSAIPSLRPVIQNSLVGSKAVAPVIAMVGDWGARQLRERKVIP